LYHGLHYFVYILRSGIARFYDRSIFSFLGTFILLSIVVALFKFPPTVQQASFFCTSSPVFVVNSHSNWGKAKCQCCFDLPFLYDQRCWPFLCVFIGYLYLFWELSVPFICQFIQGCWLFAGLVCWALFMYWLLIPC
jgi:hypothetical protein